MFSKNMLYYKSQLETEKAFSSAVPSVILEWLWETQKNETLLMFAEDKLRIHGRLFSPIKEYKRGKKVKEKKKQNLEKERGTERDGGRKRV